MSRVVMNVTTVGRCRQQHSAARVAPLTSSLSLLSRRRRGRERERGRDFLYRCGSFKGKGRRCNVVFVELRDLRKGRRLKSSAKEEVTTAGGETEKQPQLDVLAAYGVLGGTLLAGNLPGLPGIVASPLPYFTLLASSAVYIGSKRGLVNKQVEMISLKQGAAAPVILSVSLFGVYLIQKLDISLETFINGYFFLLESLSGGFSLFVPCSMIGAMMGEKAFFSIDSSWLVESANDNGDDSEPEQLGITPSLLLVTCVAVTLAAFDRFGPGENFTLNNLEACFIVTTWLELLGVNSFRTAVALLSGLLFYDVFWVFGSGEALKVLSQLSKTNAFLPENGSVMADVAMSPMIAAPTKLLFPRDSIEASFKFSLLGLGDILVPGLLVGLLLRFDSKKNDAGEQTYFKSSLGAYGLGLCASFAASFLSGTGQPALLYLVPLTVGSAVAVGLQRAEVKELWNFKIQDKQQL